MRRILEQAGKKKGGVLSLGPGGSKHTALHFQDEDFECLGDGACEGGHGVLAGKRAPSGVDKHAVADDSKIYS